MRVLFALVLAALAACGERDSTAAAPAEIPVLVAPLLGEGEAVLVDGRLGDAAWRKSSELTVALAGEGVAEVKLKAAWDGRRVYLLAVWRDEERSLNRYWTDAGGLKYDLSRREDAFLVCWAPGDAPAFREQGCALFCHDGAHRYPGTGRSLADFWLWGAQTTAFYPQARDMALRQGAEHRLRGDNQPARSGNVMNRNKEFEGPAYYPIRVRRGSARILTHDNAQPITAERKRTKLSGPENIGREIPYDVLRPRGGSRGDVRAAARHHGGRAWVLELVRALDTGQADDLPLGDPLVPVLFSVAICDDQDYGQHTRSGPIELRFAE